MISLQIKIMCRGSDSFILIIFYLVSNVYIALFITVHVLLLILDILNSKNKDYDSVETCDCGSIEISDTASVETDGPSGKQAGGHRNTEVSGCERTETGGHGRTETGDHGRTESDNPENNQHMVMCNVDDNHKKTLPQNTPVQKSITSTRRSPLAELVYPTPTQKVSKAKSCARVLTSAESIAMLEEKACKREEQEEKE